MAVGLGGCRNGGKPHPPQSLVLGAARVGPGSPSTEYLLGGFVRECATGGFPGGKDTGQGGFVDAGVMVPVVRYLCLLLGEPKPRATSSVRKHIDGRIVRHTHLQHLLEFRAVLLFWFCMLFCPVKRRSRSPLADHLLPTPSPPKYQPLPVQGLQVTKEKHSFFVVFLPPWSYPPKHL